MSRFEGFGDALRLLRKRRGESSKELAEAIGVHPTLVSRWEHGSIRPNLDRLGRLAGHFRLHLGDLDDVLADATGRPRSLGRIPMPRNPEEVDAFLAALLGPAPAEAAEAAPQALVRATLRVALEHAARIQVSGKPGA